MSDNINATVHGTIGQRIRHLRSERGWSLAELARRVGTSAPTLHRYENGWDRFELGTLRKIASALGARLELRLVEAKTPWRSRPTQPGRVVRVLAPLFWDHDLTESDLEGYPGWVLERVLTFGNPRQVGEAANYFGVGPILEAIERRGVDDRTRNYWRLILEGVRDETQGAEL